MVSRLPPSITKLIIYPPDNLSVIEDLLPTILIGISILFDFLIVSLIIFNYKSL
jgi:hypothetical protein